MAFSFFGEKYMALLWPCPDRSIPHFHLVMDTREEVIESFYAAG